MKDEANIQNDPANDYVLARLLNEYVIKIFTLLADYRDIPDTTAVNRSYVLLANELKQIYARQPELQKIGQPICWQVIDNLELFHENIAEYKTLAFEYTQSGSDYGEEHNSRVGMLCIKADKEKPDITPELQKLLNEADKNFTQFKHELDKMYATLSFESISVPAVTIGDEKFRLGGMREGFAFNIVSHCLQKHPDVQIDLETLKAELEAEGLKTRGLTNLKDKIHNSIFGDKELLNPFVQAFPKVILVRKTTELSDEQLNAIKSASS